MLRDLRPIKSQLSEQRPSHVNYRIKFDLPREDIAKYCVNRPRVERGAYSIFHLFCHGVFVG